VEPFLFSFFGSTVKIGRDCMMSKFITIGNNDGHPIYDIETNKQINIKRSIIIGNHVWLGTKCTILSGSKIGEGSIVGANSLVNRKFDNNCIIAGNPACLKRKDIAWERSKEQVDLIEQKLYWNRTI
jgi:acetyltransferase-like isoleucine patch superfamily enzyme